MLQMADAGPISYLLLLQQLWYGYVAASSSKIVCWIEHALLQCLF
jgi:hypothetical protein